MRYGVIIKLENYQLSKKNKIIVFTFDKYNENCSFLP